MSNKSLVEELKWRGFVNQTTYPDLFELDKQPLTFYHGYDASADSLTIGNLAAVMMDKVFIRHGYNPIILAGGATSLIGDPGGKDSERPLQSPEVVQANVEAVNQQLHQLLGDKIQFVNNLDWYKNLNVLSFLRDVGKHFSVTPLIQRDYIANRLGEGGSGISFTELSYTLLQGYDYLILNEKFGVTLQLAGSDQWGNSLSGVELIKKVKNQVVHVLTCPLIVNQSTGKKFGKSEAGAVWLDANKTNPNDFYQFWINLDDKGVKDYLKIYTELDESQIDEIMSKHAQNPSARVAQKRLAEEVTRMVHGFSALTDSKENSDIFTNPSNLSQITDQNRQKIIEQLGDHYLKVSNSASIIATLANSPLASSNSEARRLINENGIYLNDEVVKETNFKPEDFKNGFAKLRRGKAIKDTIILEEEKN